MPPNFLFITSSSPSVVDFVLGSSIVLDLHLSTLFSADAKTKKKCCDDPSRRVNHPFPHFSSRWLLLFRVLVGRTNTRRLFRGENNGMHVGRWSSLLIHVSLPSSSSLAMTSTYPLFLIFLLGSSYLSTNKRSLGFLSRLSCSSCRYSSQLSEIFLSRIIFRSSATILAALGIVPFLRSDLLVGDAKTTSDRHWMERTIDRSRFCA